MMRCGRICFTLLVAVFVLAPGLARPGGALAARELKLACVPNFFPAQPDNQPLGPAHGGAAVDPAGNVYASTDTPRGVLVLGPGGKCFRSFGPSLVHGLY